MGDTQRVAQATAQHVATQPIMRRPTVEIVRNSSCNSPAFETFGSPQGPQFQEDLDFDEPRMVGETPREAAQRRRREAADREAERLSRSAAVEAVAVRRRPKPPSPPETFQHDERGPPFLSSPNHTCSQPSSPSHLHTSPPQSVGARQCNTAPQRGIHETPREAARRRKVEAADKDVARLCSTHVEASIDSRHIGQRLRDSHARSFVAPFATGDDQQHRSANFTHQDGTDRVGQDVSSPSLAVSSSSGRLHELPGHSLLTPCRGIGGGCEQRYAPNVC